MSKCKREELHQKISDRFRSVGVLDKRIVRDMAVVMAFALLAKLAGAAKEIAVAWRYGLDEVVDAYIFVFNLVSLPITIWFSILTVVFIPLVSKSGGQSREALFQFRSQMLGATIASGLALALVCYLTLSIILDSRFIGLSAETLAPAFTFARWLSLLIPVGLLIQFGSVLLMSEGRHRNTLFEAIPAIALLIAVLSISDGGAAPLILGALSGYAAHLVVLVASLARRRALRWPSLSFSSPVWAAFFYAVRFMLLAQILQAGSIVVDQLFAARLGAGALATLGYSERILSLMVALGATAIARAMLPVLSSIGPDAYGSTRAVALRWATLMFLVGALALGIVWPWADTLVSLIFERGAFAASNTEVVAGVLRYGLVQLPFYFAALVLLQTVFSRRRYGITVAIGFGNLVTKLGAAVLLVPVLGLKGLMLSTAAMYGFTFLALAIFVWRHSQNEGEEDE